MEMREQESVKSLCKPPFIITNCLIPFFLYFITVQRHFRDFNFSEFLFIFLNSKFEIHSLIVNEFFDRFESEMLAFSYKLVE